MKTRISIILENEIGNPSSKDIEQYILQIIEHGLTRNFDLYQIVPISGISFRIEKVEVIEQNI